MKPQTVFNEIDIKTHLIDYLRKNKQDLVLGIEVPYLLGDRRVDVLQLYNNLLYAYEIKSDKDNLKKLPEQINEYSSTFDFISVIITPKHYSYIKKNSITFLEKVGLIIFDDYTFKEIKKPKQNKIKKKKLCYFLNRRTLNRLTNNKDSTIEISYLRDIVSKKNSMKIIKESAYSTLVNKYKERYDAFLSSVGVSTLPDDLKILSSSLTF